MEVVEFKSLVEDVVAKAMKLKDDYTDQKTAKVNYSAIFSHNPGEYAALVEVANEIGKVIDDTPTGPLFHIEALDTCAGQLKLVKVRKPDETRKERGDADFTVSDYDSFKRTYLPRPGFRLITRSKMEMIELTAPGFDVRAYFSNPPLDLQFAIK